MTTYDRGDVILVDIAFSGAVGYKRRPAVVISSNAFNAAGSKLIVPAITSNVSPPFRPGDALLNDHLDIDHHQPFGKYGLGREWERFSSQLDPGPLAATLRARIVAASRSGAVLSFPSTRILPRDQYYRRPDRIVVDKSSGRVIEINDRDYGETEAVQLGPEHLTDADKKYIASEFVRSLYQIGPATRSKDIERALRMMLPDSALKFARY